MKLGIVGGGVVGHATARCFIEYVDDVLVYDVLPERATASLPAALSADIVFVCLPTPAGPNGCDTSAVEAFFAAAPKTGNYVLRSTVPIGFTKRMVAQHKLLNLCHSPEFLTARCALTDIQLPSRNIIGTTAVYYLASKLVALYKRRFPGIQVQVMESCESEAVKLFLNSFFATKVAFFNEIHQLASKLGLHWNTVLAGMLSDGRIAHSHTKVPGPDGSFGFGGTCLPKDLENLMACQREAGLEPCVTFAANFRNKVDRCR